MLTINEIFHSIQGESTYAGRPCVFVRLTACDLRCRWCDTPYAFHEGRKMSVDEVVADVEARGCQTVEVTGGEPLLQPDVYPLMQRLLDAGKTVLLETGGHRSIADVPAGVIRIMDVKCPGSGESDKNDWSNLAHLTKTRRSEVRDRRSRRLRIREGDRAARELCRRVSTRCCSRRCTASSIRNSLSEWVIADRLDVRVQLQVHKYIWSPETRGV